MLTRALRLFNVRFTTVYCLAVLIFSSQTRLFCTVYRQYTCIYTLYMWKGEGLKQTGGISSPVNGWRRILKKNKIRA